LLLQLPLAGRLKLLDRLFALPGLVRQHRYHAWIIALMALLHPLCVSIPEDRLLIPLEMRYWPEWIGVALLSLIVLQFVASQWRKRLKIVLSQLDALSSRCRGAGCRSPDHPCVVRQRNIRD
jgi:predicted ferric reductase